MEEYWINEEFDVFWKMLCKNSSSVRHVEFGFSEELGTKLSHRKPKRLFP